ncbi:MAG: replication initiation protein [Pseudomonadota bacterium]|nr:replication initiation protein [Pseudomonadota bacterium]
MKTITPAPVFKKPNSALVMMPKIGKLTAVSRKIFNVLLHATQRQVHALAEAGKIVEATHYFSARLDELVSPVEQGNSNLTSCAKKSLLEMRRTEVDWEAPDAHSGVIWSNMSLLSEAKIVKTRGILYAYWALPPGLLSVIADPQRFTPIDIAQLSQLKTYTAVALYEICVRYKNNPTGLTSENALEWWVDALTQSAPKIDPKTKKPKLRLWSKFKSEQVNAAIDEINTKSDIGIELIEKKTGKAVTSAQFKVWRKAVDAVEVVNNPRLTPAMAEMVGKLGLQLGDISHLLKLGHGESILNIALTKLQARIEREDLTPIESKLAYLKTVLAETGGYVAAPPPAARLTVASVLPALNAVADLPKVLSYQEHRRQQIKEEVLNMSKDRQKKYAELALEYLQKAGIATTTLSRKVESGVWTTGVLFSKMIEIYALEQYGPDWGVDHQHDSDAGDAVQMGLPLK